jgi:hypothetical protein
MNRKTTLRDALFLLSGIALMIAMSHPVHAQDPRMQNVMFPTPEVLRGHNFDPIPVKIKVNDSMVGKISFDIPIPGKDWQRIPAREFSSDSKVLAGFIHPEGPDHGMIQVMEYKPPYEMAPNDWLLFTLEQGFMKVITTAGEGLEGSGPYFEALAISALPDGSSDEPMMMRAAVFRNGNTFFFVRAMASTESFLRQAYYFGSAIHGFKIHDIKPVSLVGEWSKQCIASYCFTGPVPGPEAVESGREEIKIHYLPLSLEGGQTGRLNINVIQSPLAKDTSAEERINNLLLNMTERSGMSFQDEWATLRGEHQNLGGNTYYARNEGLGSDSSAISFFALSWEGEREAVLVYMLTDARQSNPVAWMKNKRTFEIITQSLTRKQ